MLLKLIWENQAICLGQCSSKQANVLFPLNFPQLILRLGPFLENILLQILEVHHAAHQPRLFWVRSQWYNKQRSPHVLPFYSCFLCSFWTSWGRLVSTGSALAPLPASSCYNYIVVSSLQIVPQIFSHRTTLSHREIFYCDYFYHIVLLEVPLRTKTVLLRKVLSIYTLFLPDTLTVLTLF